MKNKLPKVGDIIYVGSHMYLSRGSDDVVGGKATVTKVDKQTYGVFITVAEHPGHSYNWKILEEDQDKLKKQFGNKKAYPDPDIDTPWIEDGDIVDGKVYKGKPIW